MLTMNHYQFTKIISTVIVNKEYELHRKCYKFVFANSFQCYPITFYLPALIIFLPVFGLWTVFFSN